MTRYNNLERRGKSGVYYARIDVPTDLVEHLGCEVRKKSLRTTNEGEARNRVWPVIETWRAEFSDLRSRREITADDKAVAVWEHYEATLKRDEEKRRAMPTNAAMQTEADRVWRRIDKGEIHSGDFVGMINGYADLELMKRARGDDANLRTRRLAALKRDLVAGEIRLIAHTVDGFIAKHRLLVEKLSDEYRDLCVLMTRAEIEGLERTLEKDEGDYSGVPKDPIVKPALGTIRETAKAGEGVMELFAIYERENPKSITQDTFNQARRDIGTFLDCVGSTMPVHRIDKKAVRDWKALLMQYPVKATETKIFAGMKITQIVKANETEKKPVLTPRTVNRYLSSLGAFCSWLVTQGYMDTNPVDGMSLAKEKKKTTLPFSTEQLNKLFTSPLFTGCQNPNEWRNIAKPGDVLIRDHRFWVPLVMLYSGARPAEIAQLAVCDVRPQHGEWIMHITEEGDGEKSVKTSGSMRVVPVHKELVKLGFIKYHTTIKEAGFDRLFPDAVRNARGQMIADFSREFGRYLTRIGMKDGRGLSLYSFRHGAADALRRAGHLDEQFGFILGHTSGTMTGRYGTLPQGMLEQRVELVNSISYPLLHLDHLR